MGYPGAERAAARRAADERLLPPRAHRQPLARLGAADGAGAGRPQPRAVARRHPLPRPDAGGAQPGVVDGRVPGRGRARHRRCPRKRCRASSSTSIAIAPTTSSRRPSDRAALLAFLKPRRGLYDRLSRDARLRPARARVPGVPGDLVARGARLLPQVHGGRAHAAHDPQPRTAAGDRRAGPAAVPQRARRACRRPSCWCCRCSCTTSASGATTITRSRASGWPRTRSARLQITGEARDTVLFLIRHHLRMSLVAFRRDTEDPDIVKEFAAFIGTEDRLKMLCLMTLADVGAVSPDTLTPWKEELLWRLYVDTYNHLTQRYGDERIERNQAGLDRLRRGPARRPSPRRRSRTSSRGCRSATCSCSRRRRSTSTSGWRATSTPTKCTCRSSAWTRRCGRSRSSRSTSRRSSRTSAACCRRSA